MAKANPRTKEKAKNVRKNKSSDIRINNDEAYDNFSLLRNDGILPLKRGKNIAVVECKKSQSITTSRVLYKSLTQSSDVKQFTYVSHVLGKQSFKSDIKTTVKQVKKFSVIIVFIGSDVKNEINELEELAVALKKYSSLIICYNKTNRLLSSTLISCANAVIACFNKDKEDGDALCDLILGNASPYARVCIDGAEPFAYSLFPSIDVDYAFTGFGLSYANLSYTNVSFSRYTAKVGEFTDVEVTVTNNSSYDTSEITQLYVTSTHCYKPMLVDHGKFSIKAGESVTLSFTIDTSKLDYSSVNVNGAYEFYACVGKSSTDTVRIPFRVIF